jgi:uncharacterized protein YdcH (DUF465 family)
MDKPDAQQPTLQQRRAALEKTRLRLQAEIGSYPMPIPACDAHFNHLLDERNRICEDISRLDRELLAKRMNQT